MSTTAEAIAFPNGDVFSVTRVEILDQHTSHFARLLDCENRKISLKVQRDEYSLRLIMPFAKVPLDVEGILTFGERALRTTISEIQSGDRDSGLVAMAVGIHETHTLDNT
jgi:hypothetical protein